MIASRRLVISALLLGAMLLSGCATTSKPVVPQAPAEAAWTPLFDGKTLGRWKSTQFGGEGAVAVEDGGIVLPMGSPMTGVTWTGKPPVTMDYELRLQARRVDGHDFFCALTFPYGEKSCSLIVGGWGGGIVGLSSLNDQDASENDTSTLQSFDQGRWYTIRVRVTRAKIQAWIDGKRVVNADVTDRKVGIRPEVDLSRPLGVASYETTAALRDIEFRPITPSR